MCWAGDVTPAFCQATVVQAAKAAGKYVVGYRYDAQSLDPAGWLTGSAWDWRGLYENRTARCSSQRARP